MCCAVAAWMQMSHHTLALAAMLLCAGKQPLQQRIQPVQQQQQQQQLYQATQCVLQQLQSWCHVAVLPPACYLPTAIAFLAAATEGESQCQQGKSAAIQGEDTKQVVQKSSLHHARMHTAFPTVVRSSSTSASFCSMRLASAVPDLWASAFNLTPCLCTALHAAASPFAPELREACVAAACDALVLRGQQCVQQGIDWAWKPEPSMGASSDAAGCRSDASEAVAALSSAVAQLLVCNLVSACTCMPQGALQVSELLCVAYCRCTEGGRSHPSGVLWCWGQSDRSCKQSALGLCTAMYCLRQCRQCRQ